MSRKLYVLIMLAMSSCGKENIPVPSSRQLKVILKFPVAVAKSSGHFDAFIKNVEFMKIVSQFGAKKKEYHYPPSKWDSVFLTELPCPKNSTEQLEILIEIWDRLDDGYRRSYPILVGKKSLSQNDFEDESIPSLIVSLRAEGPLRF